VYTDVAWSRSAMTRVVDDPTMRIVLMSTADGSTACSSITRIVSSGRPTCRPTTTGVSGATVAATISSARPSCQGRWRDTGL